MAKISVNFTQEDKAKGYELLTTDLTEFVCWFQKHPAYEYIGDKESCLRTLSMVAKAKDPRRMEQFWRIVVEEDWDLVRESRRKIAFWVRVVFWSVILLTGFGLYSLAKLL